MIFASEIEISFSPLLLLHPPSKCMQFVTLLLGYDCRLWRGGGARKGVPIPSLMNLPIVKKVKVRFSGLLCLLLYVFIRLKNTRAPTNDSPTDSFATILQI